MADELDWSTIARYVSGACSDEERRVVEARLASDADARDAVAMARRVWESTAPDADVASETWNVPTAWNELVRKEAATRSPALVRSLLVSRERHEAEMPNAPRRARRPWRSVGTWASAAAAAAIVTVGSVLVFRAERESHTAPVSFASAPTYTVATRPGQRLDLRMPDGTRVVLGVASTLRYPKAYGRGRRDVYLDGQAYFEVIHDEHRPFEVHARNAVAHDLGTKFDVRAYPDDGGVEVAVAEGKVELSPASAAAPTDTAGRRSVVLTPGQIGRLGVDGSVVARSGADVAQRLGWIDGRLTIADAPLRDVLPELSRWYDVDFHLVDSALGARRLTGTFEGDSLPALLQFLALSLEAEYELQGRTVNLTPRRGAR